MKTQVNPRFFALGSVPSRLTLDANFIPFRGAMRSSRILFLAFFLLGEFSLYGADLFVDKALEAAVRQQVFSKRSSKEPLTADDVKRVSTVRASGKKIRNLKGLEACKALASLELPGNEIEDISPLAGLERLQLLDLSGNQIRNLGPLEKVNALQYLNMESNEVEDLSPLAGLVNMRSLYLSDNRIAELRPLTKLEKLWSLYLSGNRIENLSHLSNLKGVKNLDLSKNKVKDLLPLAGMNSLRMLFLQGNRIEDLAPILEAARKDAVKTRRYAPYLRLWLKGNPITSDSPQVRDLSKVVREVNFSYE